MTTTVTEHHRAFLRVGRFGSLDGLRAISIIGVVWHHGPGAEAETPLLRAGFLGVHLFFVISGFLITTLLIREREAHGQISLKKFYARRALRIFPLYYTVLLLYVVLVAVLMADEPRGRQFFGNLPYFASYTSNWFVGAAPGVIFSYAWSLATEEQFYSTWPWLERFWTRPWRIAGLAVLSGLAMLSAVGFWDRMFPDDALVAAILNSISLPICLGVALAYAMNVSRGFSRLSPFIAWRWSSAAWLCLLLAGLQAGSPFVVIAIVMTLLVGACVAREDHVLAAPFQFAPIARLGVVSYGVYLLHGLVYNAMAVLEERARAVEWHRSQLEFVVALLVTFLAAELSFRFYESRFLRAKRHFAR